MNFNKPLWVLTFPTVVLAQMVFSALWDLQFLAQLPDLVHQKRFGGASSARVG